MKKVQFVMDDGYKLRDNADIGLYGSHSMLGAWHFDQKNWGLIVQPEDANKNADVQVYNYPMLVKKTIGRISKKTVLININSNHTFNNYIDNLFKPTLVIPLSFFSAFNDIVCLSNSQVEKLNIILDTPTSKLLQMFLKNRPRVHCIPAAIDDSMIQRAMKKQKLNDTYLTSGKDAGRVFDFNIKDKNIKIQAIGNGNSLPYNLYCEELVNCKGLVLKNEENPESSDLSGVTTFIEGLVAKKPVFINPQPWLTDYPLKNVYIYNTDKELEALLKKNIKWKECDLSYFLMPRYLKELRKILHN